MKSDTATLSPVVHEYRVWVLSDAHGSWPSLMDRAQPARDWTRAELWGAFPTYEEARRAVWDIERDLRDMGLDRRKRDRRNHERAADDRRARIDEDVWTAIP